MDPMILDSGIFLSQRTSVCFLGSVVVVGHRSRIECVGIRVKSHPCLHGDREKRRRSYLERIADNPTLILREKGSPKTNLKLYVSFATRGEYRPEIDGTRRQRIIKSILEGEHAVWNRILSTDMCAYEKLSNTLEINRNMDSKALAAKRELEDVARMLRTRTLQMSERDAVCEILEGRLLRETRFALRVHHDFCTDVETRTFVDDLKREYSRMLDAVLHDKIDQDTPLCMISHPFYREAGLFNAFVACRGNLSLFDADRVRENVFHSMSERGVRDFVSEKIERHRSQFG